MDFKRFEDYREGVIQAYKKKKNEGKLPPNLERHTPANLKRECLAVFTNRYSTRDENTFKAFFKQKNSPEEYYKMIEKADPDIFRPLNSFLRRNTDSGTYDRNIELLAWLIDYAARPYRPAHIYHPTSSGIAPTSAAETEPGRPDTPLTEIVNKEETEIHSVKLADYSATASENQDYSLSRTDHKRGILGIPQKLHKTIGALTAIAITIIISFILIKPQCMYWNGKEYQSIDCNAKIEGVSIIALDTTRLGHVKKITNTASITRSEIGKVYYSKVNGLVEFYTGKGENPEDSNRRLLPMTEYIYEKYVLHKRLP